MDVHLPAEFRSGDAARFALRLDVDRNPAHGWKTTPVLVRSKSRPFAVTMHDLPSLFAGKLHVLCCRTDRAKGRDFFDLAWYLSREISPNLAFLEATIQALEPKPWPISEWRTRLIQRLDQIDFDQLRRDLAPFLMEQADTMLLDPHLLAAALEALSP